MELEGYTLSIVGKQSGEGKLHFEAACSPSPPQEAAYAFYLFHNQERVQTKWYTTEPWADFLVSRRGVYHVTCFFKQNGAMKTADSNPILFIPSGSQPPISRPVPSPLVPFSIFGSCVSRDMLEFAARPLLELKSYIARQTVSSAISSPLPCQLEDIRLNSKFQQRMVYYDLSKATFPLLRSDGSRYLLLDLVDERFQSAAYRGSLITLSDTMLESGFLDGSEQPVEWAETDGRYQTAQGRFLEEDIALFCRQLLSCYPPERILLHRVMHTAYYRDASTGRIERFSKNTTGFYGRINQRMDWMYQQIASRLPGCRIIDLCGEYCADSEHKWGLASIHFEPAYYQKVFEEVEKIILEAPSS